jgi:hydrogenase expression/formation protein HypD
MSIVDFSDPKTGRRLLDAIAAEAAGLGHVRIMEVCGTHTMEIGRMGLRSLLPKNIELVSGPGCPVCVTPGSYIDAAADLALVKGVRVLTYGDMIRVLGVRFSLEQVKAKGAKVDVVTSPLQAIETARANPIEQIVFLAVGFETTAPATARAIDLAYRDNLSNLTFFVSHKIVPPALCALIEDTELAISGFMLPGHVSAIIGETPYAFLAKRGIPAVITGFEPLDILSGILSLCTMLKKNAPALVNAYTRIVKKEGNPKALEMIDTVFETTDALWRGIGMLKKSGLVIREKYRSFDAARRFSMDSGAAESMPEDCSCGDVLKGRIRPDQCPLFGSSCTPASPVGPCMVSSEGSCAAYFKFGP